MRLPLGVAILALVPGAAAGVEETADAQPRLALIVEPSAVVADLDRALVEQRIAVALVEAECGVELVRAAKDADHRLRVELLRWWEQERPGGARRFDPERGRYLSGREFEIQIRFRATLERIGVPKPLEVTEKNVRRQFASTSNWLYDPRMDSMNKALDSLAERVIKLTCKSLSKKRRSGSKSSKKRRSED